VPVCVCVTSSYLSSFWSRQRRRRRHSVTLIIGFAPHRRFIDMVMTPYASYYNIYNASRYSTYSRYFCTMYSSTTQLPLTTTITTLWTAYYRLSILGYMYYLISQNSIIVIREHYKLKCVNVYFSLIIRMPGVLLFYWFHIFILYCRLISDSASLCPRQFILYYYRILLK